MKKTQVISLDPIDRKKELGLLGKLIITRFSGGKKPAKQEPYGHYMFCGEQRAGKSTSKLWYLEKKVKYYKNRKLNYIDELGNIKKFDTPPEIKIYSNMGFGKNIERDTLFSIINNFDPYANTVRFVLIDEIHGYFPKESRNKTSLEIKEQLISLFSQLGKRNTFIFSTAQVYGRLDKALREQCLFMIVCKKSFLGYFVNEFISGDDILCDVLGRWAGKPKVIYVHGLPKNLYDTKRLIIK